MEFMSLPPFFPGQNVWGASKGPYTFIITQDRANGFTASAKGLSGTPFDGNRIDLGDGYCAYSTLEEAQKACEDFYSEKTASKES